jgi:hypothetical protein
MSEDGKERLNAACDLEKNRLALATGAVEDRANVFGERSTFRGGEYVTEQARGARTDDFERTRPRLAIPQT